MKCILCDSVFPQRSVQEILEDEAIEYLCNYCYETDFEIVHGVPSKNSFRDEIKDTVDLFVNNRIRRNLFVLDDE